MSALGGPPAWIANVVEFLSPGIYDEFVKRVVNAIGSQNFNAVRVTSWYRTPFDNSRVGGDPSSQHLLGLAVDLQIVDRGGSSISFGMNPFRLQGRLRDMGLTAVVEGDHVHVQVFPAGVVAPLTRWLGLSV